MLDNYPKEIELSDGENAIIRVATREDEMDLVLFFLSIPEEQRDFVRYDLTEQENLEGWFAGPNWAEAFPLVAEVAGRIVAVSLLRGFRASWCQHIGECWMVVHENSRGLGLGRIMANEACVLASELAIEKLKAEARADDPAALKTLTQLGFKQEGVLKEFIKDSSGQLHDLAILVFNVKEYSRERGLKKQFGSSPTLS